MRFGHSLIEIEMIKARSNKYTSKQEHYSNLRQYVGIPKNITSVYNRSSLNGAFIAGLTPMNDDYWVG